MLASLDEAEMALGGSPLHWVTKRGLLEHLMDAGCFDDSASNLRGEKAIHVHARRSRLKLLLILAAENAGVTYRDAAEETALHAAVRSQDVNAVQALIVFDSDVDARNCAGQTARHLASSVRTQAGNVLLFMLHSVGARRCPQGQECS